MDRLLVLVMAWHASIRIGSNAGSGSLVTSIRDRDGAARAPRRSIWDQTTVGEMAHGCMQAGQGRAGPPPSSVS
jgi:hypothetical protein